MRQTYLLDIEVVSALRGLTFKGVVDTDRAARALHDYDDVELVRYPHLGFVGRIWELRSNLSAYDASYVTLAETLGATLVTADARVSKAAGPTCRIRILGRS